MELSDAKIIPDVRLFGAIDVSKECGRRALERLESEGTVSPLRTPTGRRLLSYREAEVVMNSFDHKAA